MKHVSVHAAEVKQNSDSCEVIEFGNIGTLDGADITIDGRYPEREFAVNEKSDMVARVLSGTGKLLTQDTEVLLAAYDVVFVEHGEAYYFEGQHLKLFMACTPAWNPAQYKEIET